MIWWIMNDLNIILKGEPHLTSDIWVGRLVGGATGGDFLMICFSYLPDDSL